MNRPDDYIDEDRALGFNVWVAELELLVGMAKGRSVDQVYCGHLPCKSRWPMNGELRLYSIRDQPCQPVQPKFWVLYGCEN